MRMEHSVGKYHGLIREGATCYLNSVLQVLFMTREFREAVDRFVDENPNSDLIDPHLKELFDQLLQKPTDTCKILKKLHIDRVYEQRDAAEYLERILRMTSPSAAEIFHGQMSHRIFCPCCGTQTNTDVPFWHLPLELVNSCRENYSVENGIEEFFKTSDFSGEKQMYCDKCDTKVNATSKYVMKHHPDVLILLLKRFDFSYQNMSYVKISCIVDVPYTLKIPQNQTYELYAAVDHIGDLTGGHYTAVIKPQDDEDRWFSFDDDRVTPLDESPFPDKKNIAISSSAYLLFYRKKDSGPEDSKDKYTNEDHPATSENSAQEADNTKTVSSNKTKTVTTEKNSADDQIDGDLLFNNVQVKKKKKNLGNGKLTEVKKMRSDVNRTYTPEQVSVTRGESEQNKAKHDLGVIKRKSNWKENSKRKKKEDITDDRVQIHDADQSRLNNQHLERRKKFNTKPPHHEGEADQERIDSKQKVCGTSKTQNNGLKRQTRSQKIDDEDSYASHSVSSSETRARLTENQTADRRGKIEKESRGLQGAADREHSSEQPRFNVKKIKKGFRSLFRRPIKQSNSQTIKQSNRPTNIKNAEKTLFVGSEKNVKYNKANIKVKSDIKTTKANLRASVCTTNPSETFSSDQQHLTKKASGKAKKANKKTQPDVHILKRFPDVDLETADRVSNNTCLMCFPFSVKNHKRGRLTEVKRQIKR
ncbi:probable ubiquitin carboxyl-terminal hydrolase creB isoform X2 [Kryptolebias marmoratus]|uniref:probable ubiquitin carboxyl-terminal hydrolase creB isoform X2 n=1 Tax=Kryptolebias marmoratus TaxID=37003 RepID=UPI0007F87623|nr:probable ubiquitin carboxyl-terminal hydrolase creB isoform X2 [Kryptolebias marmoratus]